MRVGPESRGLAASKPTIPELHQRWDPDCNADGGVQEVCCAESRTVTRFSVQRDLTCQETCRPTFKDKRERRQGVRGTAQYSTVFLRCIVFLGRERDRRKERELLIPS